MLNLLFGIVVGALAIVVAEALLVIHVWNRLLRKSNSRLSQSSNQLDHRQSLAFAYNKQGIVWALDPEKVPTAWSEDKAQKEKKSKKDVLEVCPVKKYAKIVDHSLILSDPNGSQATVHLLGCTVLSVSATNLSSRKWAKRFPIKIENSDSVIYSGSRKCYLYFESSWEKESWCKAIRLASCVNKEMLNWYSKLSEEFKDYLTSLKAGYPSFMKPSVGFLFEPLDKSMKADNSSSKVRTFFKKLARKTSRSGFEERKMGEKYRSGSVKREKTVNNHLDESAALPLPSPFTRSKSQGQVSSISDADSNHKFSIDEGSLCWNFLISRLFFDAKRNTDIKSSMQARIQRTLSNMRTPSYLGRITCTGLNIGTLPPYIHSMRVLPTLMNEVWAMEVDIEYSGGAILDIETRLEVREAEFEKGIVNDSGSVDDVTSDLLEGFEQFGNQLKLSGEIVDDIPKQDEGNDKLDDVKKNSSWKSSSKSRWKHILNSIADHVSQVPISLAIKVASVRGTLRLHIKPPPSDQLWFGFTSMPEIDFNLESSLGEHKISSTHVALLLSNRFKAAIRDTLVLPNCEGICIPWMLAEKDDWTPRKVAPFVWINQDTNNDRMRCEVSCAQHGEVNSQLEATKVIGHISEEHQVEKTEDAMVVVNVGQPTQEPADDLRSQSQRDLTSSSSNGSLREPLLLSNEAYGSSNSSRWESANDQLASRSVSSREKQVLSDEDRIPRRIGSRRARMLDLGKKMGGKIEEKRRSLEEKSRHIVEKIRGRDDPAV